MTVYTLTNVYKVSDFNGLTNLQTGTFTLNAGASPNTVYVLDDDDVLEDNVNDAATGQTKDASSQVLDAEFDGIPAGSNIFSRASGEVIVTEPDGTIYNAEINQIRSSGNTYYEFQANIAPGSTFEILNWNASGNTPYSDLNAIEPIQEYELNQVISEAQANQIFNSGTNGFVLNKSDMSSLFVKDDDINLQDNYTNGGQTIDQNVQNLSQVHGPSSNGDYVVSAGYYEVENTVTGETGRLYRIFTEHAWDGTSSPTPDTLYFAFSNDFKVGDGSNIVVTSGFNTAGDVPYEYLYVCFNSGTKIETISGEVAVETLKVGDLVFTSEGEYEPIRWIGRKRFDKTALQLNPALYPVRISAGSLGQNLPQSDLLVSRQHRILVNSPIVKRIFCAEEILISAAKLTKIPGIYVDESVDFVEYFHLLFDNHELVYANGALAESLFIGPNAREILPPESLQEIYEIFPELKQNDICPKPARLIVSDDKKAQKLIHRHIKTQKTLAGY